MPRRSSIKTTDEVTFPKRRVSLRSHNKQIAEEISKDETALKTVDLSKKKTNSGSKTRKPGRSGRNESGKLTKLNVNPSGELCSKSNSKACTNIAEIVSEADHKDIENNDKCGVAEEKVALVRNKRKNQSHRLSFTRKEKLSEKQMTEDLEKEMSEEEADVDFGPVTKKVKKTGTKKGRNPRTNERCKSQDVDIKKGRAAGKASSVCRDESTEIANSGLEQGITSLAEAPGGMIFVDNPSTTDVGCRPAEDISIPSTSGLQPLHNQLTQGHHESLANFAAVNLASAIKAKKPKTPVKRKKGTGEAGGGVIGGNAGNLGDIKKLLLQFEGGEGKGGEEVTIAMDQSGSGEEDDSDWEEVKDVGVPEQTDIKSQVPKQSVEVTLEASSLFRKKKKKKFDMQEWFRLHMNRFKRDTQLALYKVHLLCLLSHGFHRNRLCNSPLLQAAMLSIVPKTYQHISHNSLSVASLARITQWFTSVYTIDNDLDPGYDNLEMTLVSRQAEHTVHDSAELVYAFIALLRMLGLDTRLVTSLRPTSHKATDLKMKTKGEPEDQPSTSGVNKAMKKVINNKPTAKANSKQTPRLNRRKKSCDQTGGTAPLVKHTAGSSHGNGRDHVSPYFSDKNAKDKVTGKVKGEKTCPEVGDCSDWSVQGLNKKESVKTERKNGGKSTEKAKMKRRRSGPENEDVGGYSAGVTVESHDTLRRNRRNSSKVENYCELSGPENEDMGKSVGPKEESGSLRSNRSRNRRSSKAGSYCELSGEEGKGEKGKGREVKQKGKRRQTSNHGNRGSDEEEYKVETVSSDEDFQSEVTKYRSPTTHSVKVKRVKSPRSSAGSKVTKIVSSDSEDDMEILDKTGTDHWAEVYLTSENKWICVDCVRALVDVTDKMEAVVTQPLQYVVAFNADGTCKDITCKYAQNWLSHTRKLRPDGDWWEETMEVFKGAESSHDRQEDALIKSQLMTQPIPGSVSELKNHPLYALKRHLLKFEAIYPSDAPPLGFVRGEPVYARECVHTLHSRENWMKEARVVRLKEEAYKWVKARPKRGQKLENKDAATLPLFGHWQTEDYIPPPAVNGKVPRNEYGNVELFKPSMLPGGTVHLQVPALNRVAKKLGLDCVAAMVGWDHHSGYAHPILDGWVVCEEHKDTLLSAWDEQQEIDKQREAEKREKRVFENWRKLVRGLQIRERLKKKYNLVDSKAAAKATSSQETGNADTSSGQTVTMETALAWPMNRQQEKAVKEASSGKTKKRGSKRKEEGGPLFPFEMKVETM